MRERGYNPQRFGAGVEDGCQARAALFVFLFVQSPGFVFDDVFIYGSDQSPSCFERSRDCVGTGASPVQAERGSAALFQARADGHVFQKTR